jgi:hypothetical protein
MDGDCQWRVGLLRVDGDQPVLDVRTAEAGGVAASQAGVEIDREGEALSRAQRPVRFEPGDLLLGPDPKASGLRAREHLDPVDRVRLDVLGLDRPGEQVAHCIQVVVRLARRLLPALAARENHLLGDLRKWGLPRRLQHVLHDVLALTAGRRGQG